MPTAPNPSPPPVDGAVTTPSLRTLGTAHLQAVPGDDARLSNSRTPEPHALSHGTTGEDPVEVAESQVTGLVTDLAGKVATGDSRLSDARTPTIHHLSHASGGTDELALSESQITGLASDLAAKIPASEKGAASGVATLDVSGKIVASQLPAIAISDTFVVASEAAMLALTAQTGDVAVRTDTNTTLILKGTDPTVLANWQQLLFPTDAPTPHAASHEVGGADVLTLTEGQVTNLTTDLAAKEVTANKNQANGYAGLNGSSKLTGSQIPYGSSASTACEGNDARLSNKARRSVTYTITTANPYVETTSWGIVSKPAGITTVGQVIVGNIVADADADAIFIGGVFVSWKLVGADIGIKYISGLEPGTAYTFTLEVVDA